MSDHEYTEISIPKDLHNYLKLIGKEYSMSADKLFEKIIEFQLDKIESGKSLEITGYDMGKILNS